MALRFEKAIDTLSLIIFIIVFIINRNGLSFCVYTLKRNDFQD